MTKKSVDEKRATAHIAVYLDPSVLTMDQMDVAVDILNERLQAAELELSALPYKTATEVDTPSGRKAFFDRQGDQWSLMYEDQERQARSWRKCSLDERADLAQSLPNLAKVMWTLVEDRRRQVVSALVALDEFEAFIRNSRGDN